MSEGGRFAATVYAGSRRRARADHVALAAGGRVEGVILDSFSRVAHQTGAGLLAAIEAAADETPLPVAEK